MSSLNSILKPLLVDLEKLGFYDFLASNDYSRLMAEHGHSELWERRVEEAVNHTTHYPAKKNYHAYHAELAFKAIITYLSEFEPNFFAEFIIISLELFLIKKEISDVQFVDLKKDLEIIKFPEEHIVSLSSLIKPSANIISDMKIGKEVNHKIFISHSSKDLPIIDEFVQSILRLGLGINHEEIFCTSIDGMGIRTGKDFRDEIKNKILECEVVILVISKNYKESEICLNEMGAAWVLGKEVIPIIIPPLAFTDVGGIHITSQIARLNTEGGIDKIGSDIAQILNIKFPSNVSLWNRHKKQFLLCFEDASKSDYPVNTEINKIKKEFAIADSKIASLIWHIGSYEKQFRSQETLIKKTGLRDSQIEDIIREYPSIFYRSKNKIGKIIYRLQVSAKNRFLEIFPL